MSLKKFTKKFFTTNFTKVISLFRLTLFDAKSKRDNRGRGKSIDKRVHNCNISQPNSIYPISFEK